jgi:pimeloyl-ACP methyl ester carboxylesterase
MVFSEISFNTPTSTIYGISTDAELAEKKQSNNLVLCLHGWLDNSASFIPMIKYFEASDFIAIDLPGHGKSSHKSIDAYYHFFDWIYDILTLVESNKWENIHIVGHSMGGMIASAFTAAFPEKVKSLTLIDSMGFMYGKEEESTSQLRKGMLSRVKFQSAASKSNANLTRDKAIKSRVLISDLSYEIAELIVSRNLKETEHGLQWRSDRKLNTVSPYRLTSLQAEQLVSDINVPTQLIYGSNGLDFVHDGIKQFSSMIKDFSCEKLDGGHHVHMENPKAVAILIKAFIEKTNT